MQRRERHISLKTREHFGGDQNRSIEVRTAMHHPVTDGSGMDLLLVTQPGGCRMQRCGHIRDVVSAKLAINRSSTSGAVPAQPPTRVDPVDLPLYLARQLAGGLSREYL